MSDASLGSPRRTKTVTVANGATASGVIDREHYPYMAIELPSALTLTAATINFQGAATGDGTFKSIVDEAGAALQITNVAVSTIIGIDASAPELAPIRFLKLVFGTAQAAERTLTIHLGS